MVVKGSVSYFTAKLGSFSLSTPTPLEPPEFHNVLRVAHHSPWLELTSSILS